MSEISSDTPPPALKVEHGPERGDTETGAGAAHFDPVNDVAETASDPAPVEQEPPESAEFDPVDVVDRDLATAATVEQEAPRGDNGLPVPSSPEIEASLAAADISYVDKSRYRDSEQGHYYADSVMAGGRPDGETVLAGHCRTDFRTGTFAVPEGTTITFYVPDGEKLPGAHGRAVEKGVYPEGAYQETFGPGEEVRDYTLKPPAASNDTFFHVAEDSVTVATSTKLSELLQPNMGNVHWAACRD